MDGSINAWMDDQLHGRTDGCVAPVQVEQRLTAAAACGDDVIIMLSVESLGRMARKDRTNNAYSWTHTPNEPHSFPSSREAHNEFPSSLSPPPPQRTQPPTPPTNLSVGWLAARQGEDIFIVVGGEAGGGGDDIALPSMCASTVITTIPGISCTGFAIGKLFFALFMLSIDFVVSDLENEWDRGLEGWTGSGRVRLSSLLLSRILLLSFFCLSRGTSRFPIKTGFWFW